MLSYDDAEGCKGAVSVAPALSAETPAGPGELEVLPRGLLRREIFFCMSRLSPRIRPTSEAEPERCGKISR